MPRTDKSQYEHAYQLMIDGIEEQFRWNILDRRIQRLEYVHDKKTYVAQVGELENLQGRYTIMAIFESVSYVIVTQTPAGNPGVTILVDKTEAETVTDFAESTKILQK